MEASLYGLTLNVGRPKASDLAYIRTILSLLYSLMVELIASKARKLPRCHQIENKLTLIWSIKRLA